MNCFLNMDPERQPLLAPTEPDIKLRRFRYLTQEEVQASQYKATWRRARICVIFMFWAVMAIFLSIVASILMKNCSKLDPGSVPSVPPVHMSIARLISS